MLYYANGLAVEASFKGPLREGRGGALGPLP
jgi:hypothetical protein